MNKIFFLFLFIVLICALFFNIAQAEECPACSNRTLTPTPHNTSSAPGYCPSHGGSHLYEYIQDVSYTQNPGGTLTITVDIYIANPTGCTYGQPCPEYDSSPEYVNAWIDWDGDKVFEPEERVMDEALTGYKDINYHGTMTASTIVTIPENAVSSTWMRVNLGWGHDPNDPCEYSWTWGDVVDKKVTISPIKPELKKFEITGGLEQYEGKYKDLVFKRGQTPVLFIVDAVIPEGDKAIVEIYKDGSLIATLDATNVCPMWNWKSDAWSKIPDDIPVGIYKAKAKIISKEGEELVSSEEKEFYVIFDTPKGLSDVEIKAFLYDDKAKDGVWFVSDEKSFLWWRTGYDWGKIYYLRSFNEKVFGIAIKLINGEKSSLRASKKIMEWVEPYGKDLIPHSGCLYTGPLPPNKYFRYSICTAYNDILKLLSDSDNPQKFAQCADSANLFVALLRSVGIPAHPVTADADRKKAGWRFDTWAEAFINDGWVVFHPHEGLGPDNRRNAGEWGWISDKEHNDIIIYANPSWKYSELDDGKEDVKFGYKGGEPKKDLDLIRPWITELSEQYWGVPHEDPPGDEIEKDIIINITLDKFEYHVGEMLYFNVSVSNTRNTSVSSELSIKIFSDNLLTPISDIVLASWEQNVTILPNDTYFYSNEYILPYNLSSENNYFVEVSYAGEVAICSFTIKPYFSVNISTPSQVALHSPANFTVSITISNEKEESINNLTACLDTSYNLNVIDPCKSIAELLPHSNITFSWSVEATKSDIGSLYFEITSENGGTVSFTKHIDVLSPPILDIENKYIEVSEKNLGIPFELSFKVRNIGDLDATNISVNIDLPKDVTAMNTVWHIDELAGGEELILHTNVTFIKSKDFVIYVYASDEQEHNTTGIIYVHILPAFSGSLATISDYGVDTDGDGLYNYLRVNAGVNVTSAGEAVIKGILYDLNGNKIMEVKNSTYLDTGTHTVALNFDGFTIFKHKTNGPYLVNLKLEDKEGNLLDEKNHTTSAAYNYTNFQHLVALTGYYSDYGRDVDNDGIYDYLTIDIGVFMAKPGHCFIKARLVDANGEEIVWAENTTWLEAGEQIIQLHFNGSAIYEHGVDGPYYLRDVYVYHTGDPTQSDYVYEAYTTKAYSTLNLERIYHP